MLTIDAHRDAGLAVVSAAAGRMRIHTNGFRIDGGRAVAIEEMVGKLTGVRAVRVYPRTASVVIRYSPEHRDTAAVLSAIAEAEHFPAASAPARAPRSADIGNGGVVGKVIGGIGRTLLGRHRDELDRPPQVERLRKALDRIGYHLEPVTASPPSPREGQTRDSGLVAAGLGGLAVGAAGLWLDDVFRRLPVGAVVGLRRHGGQHPAGTPRLRHGVLRRCFGFTAAATCWAARSRTTGSAVASARSLASRSRRWTTGSRPNIRIQRRSTTAIRR